MDDRAARHQESASTGHAGYDQLWDISVAADRRVEYTRARSHKRTRPRSMEHSAGDGYDGTVQCFQMARSTRDHGVRAGGEHARLVPSYAASTATALRSASRKHGGRPRHVRIGVRCTRTRVREEIITIEAAILA